jgi:hypothetical protein
MRRTSGLYVLLTRARREVKYLVRARPRVCGVRIGAAAARCGRRCIARRCAGRQLYRHGSRGGRERHGRRGVRGCRRRWRRSSIRSAIGQAARGHVGSAPSPLVSSPRRDPGPLQEACVTRTNGGEYISIEPRRSWLHNNHFHDPSRSPSTSHHSASYR